MTLYDEGIKVHVPTPEISKLVQEKLFEKGCGWRYFGKEPQFSDAKYLYVTNNIITHSEEYTNYFNSHTNKQVHYLQVLVYFPSSINFLSEAKS